MMRLLSFYLFAICLALPSLTKAAEATPVLSFLVTRQIVKAEGESKETFPLKVTLGEHYLTTETNNSVTVYDFLRDREYLLDRDHHTFQEFSLYSDVGFRVLEFFNRVNLRAMAKAGNLDLKQMDLAQIEQLFSLTADASDTVIDSAKVDGTTQYSSKHNLLMVVSNKTKPLPAAYQHEYWRFMRYYVGGHPAIYEALGAVSGVPLVVVVELHDRDAEKRTLELQSIKSTPEKTYSLEGYERTPPLKEPFVSAALVTADAPAAVDLRYAEARRVRDAAYARADNFGALLAYDEMSLSTGVGEPEWLRMAHDRLIADPVTRRLNDATSLGSPGVHDPAAQSHALEDFEALRALKPDYIDVLDVFEGNLRITMRDEKGRELLFDALKLNPYLTGAWHDLGDTYYRAFRLQEAWTCWDTARRIAPTNPMMKQVNQLEQAFRSKNPQFF